MAKFHPYLSQPIPAGLQHCLKSCLKLKSTQYRKDKFCGRLFYLVQIKCRLDNVAYMREGILFPDYSTGRVDIRFSCEEFYGGLHCGTTMDVWLNDHWIPSRIEMSGQEWYLVGIHVETIFGLKVRI